MVSALLMLIVALVAMAELSGLRNARAWRRHTVDVILAATAFQNNLLDTQRGLRGYSSTGDTNALVMFQEGLQLEPSELNHLLSLTSDNVAQQSKLKSLSSSVSNLFAYDSQVMDVSRRRNISNTNMDASGQIGRELFGTALSTLKTFTHEEESLLDQRDAVETQYAQNAERLLIAVSVLAAILLIAANLIAGYELSARHRVEAQLHRALLLQKAILDSADYGIVTTNPDGIIQTFNFAAEKLLGYSAKDVIGHETPTLWRDAQEIAERAQKLSARLGVPVRPSFEAIAKKVQFDEIDEGEWTFVRKDGHRFIASLVVTALTGDTGNFTGFIGIFRNINARKSAEEEREKLILELKDALAQVKTLSGLIPICGWCKSIRNDTGYWTSVEHYVKAHTEATFTHGICPECQEKFKADIARANGGQLVK